MSLHDLQTALGGLIAGTSWDRSDVPSGGPPQFDLTVAERAWLARLGGSPGFEVTRHVRRWWRRTRILWTARLTVTALGQKRAAEALDRYLEDRTGTTPSLFFTAETVGFLNFLLRDPPAIPHSAAVARFERALLLAAEVDRPAPAGSWPGASAVAAGRRLEPHPAAAVVDFDAAPEAVLGALLFGGPLPLYGESPTPVLVSPGLPDLWRLSCSAEVCCFARIHDPRSATDSPDDYGTADLAIAALWNAGAVRLAP